MPLIRLNCFDRAREGNHDTKSFTELERTKVAAPLPVVMWMGVVKHMASLFEYHVRALSMGQKDREQAYTSRMSFAVN